MKAWLKRNCYRIYYYKKKVKIGANSLLNIKNMFEGHNVIGNNCEITTSLFGFGTYVADNSVIKYAKIGKFCSIGSFVQTGLGTHPAKVFVSTHPAFFSIEKQAGFTFVENNIFNEQIFLDREERYVVEIGNDVWIGNNVLIMDGLTIGDGAIIAAGSVVTKDVLPYTIMGGVPAKFIKLRFTEPQIKKLLDTEWWNWNVEKIKAKSSLFANINLFTEAV
jgi:acetyltransferase-like isoleucine patch superfamily enzyme